MLRVEITGAAKSWDNTLLIRVVNLWIHRMIGDEQLPEDSARKPDGTLSAWPIWLDAKKAIPTGRTTSTSWRLWRKDAPLRESGLEYFAPKNLRHSFATGTLVAPSDLHSTSKLLGHRRVTTTDASYLQPVTPLQREAVRKLQEAVRGRPTVPGERP